MCDVYIPLEKDKLGKRFGFVRMKDVGNEEITEEKLKEIWIGSYKLQVNIPRVQRSNVPFKGWPQQPVLK